MDFLISNLDRDNYPDVRAQHVVATIQRIYVAEFQPLTRAVPLALHYVADHQLTDTEPGLVIDPRSDDSYLGEHHLDKVPRSVMLTGACKKYGEDPDETMDHEIKELGLDPNGALVVEIDNAGTEEAFEACDAVQGTPCTVDGVSMANFVIPDAYFCEVGNKYDWNGGKPTGVLKAPHTRTPGGYRLIKKPGEQWSQDEGEKIPEHKKLGATKWWTRRGQRIMRRNFALAQKDGLLKIHELAQKLESEIARVRGVR